MSENRHDCDHFASLLLEGAPESTLQEWYDHLEGCASCRDQRATHHILVATFSEETVPELSPAFEGRLQAKIEASVRVRPLKGWRMAAMIGYALSAALLLSWLFTKFPLTAVSIDTSSPWIIALALLAVPLTLWLTIGATRWLPPKRSPATTQLGLL